jgi:biotin transport system substrate-specific component
MADVKLRALPWVDARTAGRTISVVAGALVVALGAQMAVPLPGSPIPITLQVPAVLIVGGLLGPGLGAASLVLYLAMGAGGLPVFAPAGMPGVARLLGPTGGYLLAMPLAAAAVGRIAAPASAGRIALAMLAGLLIVHAGGIAQLAVLGGDLSVAMQLGSVPFLIGDLVKLLFAGLVIGKFGSRIRALV